MTIVGLMLQSGLPMWQLMYMSQYIFVFLISSFILDALIVFLLLKFFKIKMKKEVIRRTIIMAWILGFSGDFFSLVFLQLSSRIIKGVDYYYFNPNGVTITLHIVTVIISAFLTFIMTSYLFRRVAISREIAYKMAIILSTLSAPWLFIVPTYTLN